MICPKCAAQLPDGAKFCTSCGTNLAEALAEEATSAASAETSQIADPFEPATSQIPQQVPVEATTELTPQTPSDYTTPLTPQADADFTTPITPSDLLSSTEQFPYAAAGQAQPTGYDPSAQTGSFYAPVQDAAQQMPQQVPAYGAYGQQAAPGAPVPPAGYVPTNAYAQPQQQGAYAQPTQGAYAQPTQPAQGTYAQPQYPQGQQYAQAQPSFDPYPKETKKGGKGKIIGIVVGVVAVLAIAAAVFGGGGSSSSGSGSGSTAAAPSNDVTQSETLDRAEEARKAAEAEIQSQQGESAAPSSEAQSPAPGMSAIADKVTGVWVLVSYTDDGEAQDLDVLNDMGMYCYITLAPDGTASLDLFGEVEYGEWSVSSNSNVYIDLDDSYGKGTILDDGRLVFEDDDDALVFEYYSEAPDTVQASAAPATAAPIESTRS